MGQAAFIAVTIAAAAASAYAQHRAAMARKAIAERNKRVAQMAADRARAKGQVDEATHRMRVSQFLGRQRAIMSARGAVIDRDSPLRLVEDTVQFGELDAKAIENHAESVASGYEANAELFGFQADVAGEQAWLLPTVTMIQGAAMAIGGAKSLGGGGTPSVSGGSGTGQVPTILGESSTGMGWETTSGTILT